MADVRAKTISHCEFQLPTQDNTSMPRLLQHADKQKGLQPAFEMSCSVQVRSTAVEHQGNSGQPLVHKFLGGPRAISKNLPGAQKNIF